MDKLNILLENGDLLNKDKLYFYLKLLKCKEEYTYLHSVRVSEYSMLLAIKLGLPDEEVYAIWLSGLLHDLGKLLVSNEILLGTDELAEEDLLLIKKHPVNGYNLLKTFTSEKVSLGALEHHERLDGKGYPYGIKNISLAGRIIAIADTFDAMTSDRTYQDSISFEDALNKMDSLVKEKFYDEFLFEEFKEIIIDSNYNTKNSDIYEKNIYFT